MRPEFALIAERPLARHSPKLLGVSQAFAGETAARLALGCERLARTLAAGLGRFAGGDAPMVSCAAPCQQSMADFAAGIAPLAANSLLEVGTKATPLLASLEAAVVLRLVDRAFGGQGVSPAHLPHTFPLSAQLLIERLEWIVASALVEAFGLGDGQIAALRRDGSLAQVTPFAPHEQLTVVAVTITEPGVTNWVLSLALPPASIVALLNDGPPDTGNTAHSRGPAAPAALARPADPTKAPFGDLPLRLSAIVVDMRIPFSRLSRLQPGDVLPIAVARNVPLCIAGKAVAHGTIGALDDRVAVQLTQVF